MDKDKRFPRYHKEFEEIKDYKPFLEESGEETRMEEPRPEPEEREKERLRIVKTRTIPRMEDKKPEPIKREKPMVVGGLFDRVNFLKSRIKETKETMKSREELHKEIIKDIDADIAEKTDMLAKAMDMDEKRSIKMDISILRKEKRNEDMQFWKDMLELRTELRDLMEDFQNESKILSLFRGVREDINAAAD